MDAQVKVAVIVPFSKSTMFRRTIESGTLASCKEAHSDWIRKAAIAIATPRLPPPAAAPAALPTPTPFSAAAAPDAGGVPTEPPHPSAGSATRRQRSVHLLVPEDEVEGVESLMTKIPPEFRGDVARLLNVDLKSDSPG